MGEALNGIVCYELYVHEKTLEFPGTEEFISKYQARAKDAGTDPLGYYVPPLVYATFQVLEQAVEDTKSLDQDKFAQILASINSRRSMATSPLAPTANG